MTHANTARECGAYQQEQGQPVSEPPKRKSHRTLLPRRPEPARESPLLSRGNAVLLVSVWSARTPGSPGENGFKHRSRRWPESGCGNSQGQAGHITTASIDYGRAPS